MKNILIRKSKFFKIFFWTLYGLWFAFSLLMLIPSEDEQNNLLIGDVILIDIVFFIIWWVISYIISWIFCKIKQLFINSKIEKNNDEAIKYYKESNKNIETDNDEIIKNYKSSKKDIKKVKSEENRQTQKEERKRKRKIFIDIIAIIISLVTLIVQYPIVGWSLFAVICIVGLILKTKSKKIKVPQTPKNLSEESKAKIDKIIKCIKEKTETVFYRAICEKVENIDIFSSKFGGVPYWDLNKKYPTDSKGNKIPLLAQINFEKEQFEDKRLPKTGLLQIFVATDDVNGLNFEEEDVQKDWKVIYHQEIDENIKENDVFELQIPISTKLDIHKEEYFPFYGEYLLNFKKCRESIGERNYNFDEILENVVKELFNEDLEGKPSFEYFSEEEYEYLIENIETTGHKVLGYPHFTQDDPRFRDKYKRYDTLLLQIDSGDYDIMWGDYGVANFFINRKDLENKDFSKVLYNWDCY